MYIKLTRRKHKNKDGATVQSPIFTAVIRFGRNHEFFRSTGKTTRREAMQWARAEAERLETEELPKKNSENLTVDQLFSHWWSHYACKKRSAETMKQRGTALHALIGSDTLVRTIDDDYVDDLVVDLFEGPRGERSPSTVNRYVDILRSALREGAKNRNWKDKRDQFHAITWGEYRQEEPDERDIFLTLEEATTLLRLMPTHIAQAAIWAMLTGCRLNEIKTLTWDRVHTEAKYCMVFAKGGKFRPVILSPNAIRLLDSVQSKEGAVFDLTNRRKHWEEARDKFGRPGLRWHDLRHVHGTWLRQYGGLDLKAVGRALGHTNLESTSRYAHVADRELQVATDALPDIMPGLEMQDRLQQ